MRYKEIVFDVDGTLIDTEYAVLHSLQDTVCQFTGETPEIESLTFALGITGEDALLRLQIADVDNGYNNCRRQISLLRMQKGGWQKSIICI